MSLPLGWEGKRDRADHGNISQPIDAPDSRDFPAAVNLSSRLECIGGLQEFNLAFPASSARSPTISLARRPDKHVPVASLSVNENANGTSALGLIQLHSADLNPPLFHDQYEICDMPGAADADQSRSSVHKPNKSVRPGRKGTLKCPRCRKRKQGKRVSLPSLHPLTSGSVPSHV